MKNINTNNSVAEQVTEQGVKFTLVDIRDHVTGEILETDRKITNAKLAKLYSEFKVFAEKNRKNKIVEI